MLDNMKFALRSIRANPRPYLTIVASSTIMSVASIALFHQQMMKDNKFTMLFTDEMLEALREGNPITFAGPDDVLFVVSREF